jgi:hypothetical protein
MKRFTEFLAESNWMYHGTPKDFGGGFRVNYNETILDRAIGVHFAADVTVASKFAHGLYRDKYDSWTEKKPVINGVVYRVKAPTDSKTLIVPQKHIVFKNGGGTTEGDQGAVGGFIAATVFEERPDLFVDWITRSRNITPEEGRKVYDAVKSGKMPPPEAMHEKDPHDQSIRSLIKNYDSLIFMLGDEKKAEVAKAFDAIMQQRGIDALIYKNTSPMETQLDDEGKVKVRSNKTYILLAHALDRYPVETVPSNTLTTATA